MKQLKDGDFRLITERKQDPCIKCTMGVACCGCPESREYRQFIDQVKAAGVLTLRQKYQAYAEIQDRINELRRQIGLLGDEQENLFSELHEYGLIDHEDPQDVVY